MIGLGLDLSGLAGGSLIFNTSIDTTGHAGVDYGMVIHYAVTGLHTTISGNAITVGTGDTALVLYADADATNVVTVTGNTISGSGTAVGVLVTDDGTVFGDTPSSGTTHVKAATTANTISGFTTGISVTGIGTGVTTAAIGDGTTAGRNAITGGGVGTGTGILVTGTTATATIAGNTGSIDGWNTGIDVNGGTATITGNHIYGNTTGIKLENAATATAITGNDFSNATPNSTDLQILDTSTVTAALTSNVFDASGFFIDEASTGQAIVTALSTLDTADGGTNTYTGAANFFTIETRIHDRVDTDRALGVGLVVFDANNVFVTTPTLSPLSTDSDIQRGIDAVPAPGTGWTVNIQAGTYKENVTVDRSVTLLGANAGTAGSASRVAETTVITNGNQSAIFYVTSSHVTINGFTIDGDDPSVTGLPVYSGEDANAAYGVTNFNGSTAALIDHLTVENNIVENVAIGTRLQTNASTVSTGSLITNNWFHDIGNFDFGYAVSLRNSFYADVTSNLMTRVWTGIHLNNFSGAGGPASWNISNNTIQSYAGGILYWLEFNGATPATFDHDSISLETTGVAAAPAGNFGIFVVSVQNAINPTFTNDTVTGTDYGVAVFNAPTSHTITLGSTDSITNTKLAAVFVSDKLATTAPIGTTTLGIGAATTVNLNGVGISGSLGAGVLVDASGATATGVVVTGTTIGGSSGTTGIDIEGALASASVTSSAISGFATGVIDNGGTLTVGAGDSISGGTTGLSLSGSTAAVTGDTLSNLVFSGQSVNTITLGSGALLGQTLDATGASFAGHVAESDTTADLYGVEDTISDVLDAAGTGYVKLKSGNVYVTPGSDTTSNGAIERAIGVASAGNTLHIAGGSFTGNVDTGTKGLVLSLGDPAQVTINGNLTLHNTDTLDMEIDGLTAGTGYDQLVVSGTVSLGGAALNTSGSSISSSHFGDAVTIVNNTGSSAVSGLFAGSAEASYVVVNGETFQIFYDGGDGNDVVLVNVSDTPTPPPAPTTVYADSSWSTLANGTQVTATFDGSKHYIGIDAFATITAGVAHVASGGTVDVDSGIFTESNITLTKPVTIDGQTTSGGVTLNPASGLTDSHADSSFGGTVSNAFVVQANGVTIENLSIDGGSGENFRDGIITDYRAGAFGSLTVNDVAMANIFRKGVALYATDPGAPAAVHTTGNTIENSSFTHIGDELNSFESVAAIADFNGDASITGNTISASGGGIESNILGGNNADAPVLTVSGNQVTAPVTSGGMIGLGLDLSGLGGGSEVFDNTIDTTGDAGVDYGMVIQYAVTGLGTSIHDNGITVGTGDTGLVLYADSNASDVLTVHGNTIIGSGTAVGVLVTDDGTVFGDTPSSGTTHVSLTGNAISGVATGIAVTGIGTGVTTALIGDGTTAGRNAITGGGTGTGILVTGAKATATIAGNTGSIDGWNTGIDVNAGTATITGNHIYGNTTGITLENGATATAITGNDFSNAIPNATDLQILGTSTVTAALTSNTFDASGFFIDEASTGQAIVTALSTLDTADGGTNTYTGAANFFTIETKIHDRVDTDRALPVGLVVFDANNVFVTTPVAGSTDSDIQHGIDAVPAPGTGWTVNVQAGTYKEDGDTINKPVTLIGQLDSSNNPITILEPISAASSGVNALTVTTNNVTIDNLAIENAHNDGLFASGVSNLTLSRVAVIGSFLDGIALTNVTTTALTNVTASSNDSSPDGFGAFDGVNLNGLTITGGSFTSNGLDGIYLLNASNTILSGVTSSSNSGNGLTSSGSSLNVTGGTYSDNADTGLFINSETGVTLTGVTADSNGGSPLALSGVEVRNSSNITINGGEFNTNGGVGTAGRDGNGLLFANDTGALIIEGTVTATGNALDGIQIQGAGLTSLSIGQTAGDSISLMGNGVAGVAINGLANPAGGAAITATFNRSSIAGAIGALITGSDSGGASSPISLTLDGSSFNGYDHADPAISLSSTVPQTSGALIGTADVSADNVSFDGNTITAADALTISPDIVNTISNEIYDKLMDSALGRVFLIPDTLIATPNTKLQPVLDAATNGETVLIYATPTGYNYGETNFFGGKGLELVGIGAPTTSSIELQSGASLLAGTTGFLVPTVDVDAGASINDGVTLVTSGGTVNVGVGTFAQTVLVNKSLTLQGSTVGTTTIAPPSGDGIDVTGSGTSAILDHLTVTGATTPTTASGINVGAGTMAKLTNDELASNAIGVTVNGATAFLQGDDLSNDTSVGLLVEAGALIDAGQRVSNADNFTGFGISTGNNVFHGYGSGKYAIENSNTGTINGVNYNIVGSNDAPPAVLPVPHYDTMAQGNDFGTIVDSAIEQLILHDVDDPTRGFVRFDVNKPDMTPPTSTVNALPLNQTTSTTFNVSITAQDPASATGDPDETVSGVASYNLYYGSSTDGGATWSAWTLYNATPQASSTFSFTGQENTLYRFYSQAIDVAGNIEPEVPTAEATTYVQDLTAPTTQVNSVTQIVDSASGVLTSMYTVSYSGADNAGGTGLARIDLYVVEDAGTPQLLTSVFPNTTGNTPSSSNTYTFSAPRDGVSHTFRFYSVGIDKRLMYTGTSFTPSATPNVEAAPPAPHDVTITTNFSVPTITQVVVNDGTTRQRSFIGSVTITLNDPSIVALLIAHPSWVNVEQFGLDGTTVVRASVSNMTVQAVAGNSHALTINFGPGGVGGPGTQESSSGDGVYQVNFNYDGSGLYTNSGTTFDPTPQTIRFFRLLGDVNGDGTVNTTDVNLVTNALGLAFNPNDDTDGDGTISSHDRNNVLLARNRSVTGSFTY